MLQQRPEIAVRIGMLLLHHLLSRAGRRPRPEVAAPVVGYSGGIEGVAFDPHQIPLGQPAAR